MKKIIIKRLLLLAAMFLLLTGGVLSGQAKAGGKIALSYKSLTMSAGDCITLRTTTDKGLRSSEKVRWKSSDKKIASVDKNGVVKAKKKGKVTITATAANKKIKASCKITVQKKKAVRSKILVAYFSCTNTTKGIAQKIAKATGGDLYRITPAKAYSAKDLNYNNDSSRTTKEQNNRNYRPQLKGKSVNMKKYDTVYIGYPIWWGEAPRVISTFLESYDLSGKKVIPFCTSGSSGISESVKLLKKQVKAKWGSGKRFSGDESLNTVKKWVGGRKENEMITIQVGKNTFTAKLADNSSAKALTKKLEKGPITIAMHDYGNFEKVGPLGFELPTNDEQITTQPGDIILYQGDQITIYYDKNTWNFTRLGKIRNVSAKELKEALGKGDVRVTLSLK